MGRPVAFETDSNRARAFKRAPMAGRVFIHDEDRLYIAPLNNLSAGGFFVDYLVNIPEGAEVRVVIKSSRLAAPVQAVGTVVRVEDAERRGLAVEFTSITKQSREIIQNGVAEARVESALKAA